jgi:hypothetical protein
MNMIMIPKSPGLLYLNFADSDESTGKCQPCDSDREMTDVPD